MQSAPRGRTVVVVIVLAAAVVFLAIEAIEALLLAERFPGALRFAAFHTVYVLGAGILAVLAVIAAAVLSPRWLVVLIGAVIAAAAVALLFV